MHEPAVTLTDFAIALECAVFVVLLARVRTGGGLRTWWMVLFATIGVASLFGGVTHGFVPDRTTVANRALWRATLLALGGTSLAAWVLGARLMLPVRAQRLLIAAAAIVLSIYAIIVTTVSDRFTIALAMYLAATVFLTAAVIREHRRDADAGWASTIAGLVLTFVAGGIQQARITVHPVYFDHNALYHAVQAVALWLVYRGSSRALPFGRDLAGPQAREPTGPQSDKVE